MTFWLLSGHHHTIANLGLRLLYEIRTKGSKWLAGKLKKKNPLQLI
jgi:hypothetical protein